MTPGHRRAGAALAALAALVPALSRAADGSMEEMVQEFFLSETVYAQEADEVQMTLEFSHQRQGRHRSQEAGLALEYGLTDRLQASVTLPGRRAAVSGGRADAGFGDIEVGALYNVYRRPSAALSLALEASVPTGDEDKGLGEGETGWEPALIAARQWGRVQAHASVGAAIADDGTDYQSAVAAVVKWKNLRPTLELTGLGGARKERALTPGLVWQWADGMEIGAGAPVGLASGAAKDGVVVKATVEFGGADDESSD